MLLWYTYSCLRERNGRRSLGNFSCLSMVAALYIYYQSWPPSHPLMLLDSPAFCCITCNPEYSRIIVTVERSLSQVSYHGAPEKAYEVFVSSLTAKFLELGMFIPSLEDHNPAGEGNTLCSRLAAVVTLHYIHFATEHLGWRETPVQLSSGNDWGLDVNRKLTWIWAKIINEWSCHTMTSRGFVQDFSQGEEKPACAAHPN